jgi:hypothetical protein
MKGNEVKNVYFSNMPVILLVYTIIYFNITELDTCIPSVCVSLLWDYKDIFSNEIPSELPPIKGIEHLMGYEKLNCRQVK